MKLITDLWAAIELENALSQLVEAVSSQVTAMVPIGIALIAVLATPRIVKKVIHTFL